MTENTFEFDLRAALAARDPGIAPADLASVVRGRLQSDRASAGRTLTARRLAERLGGAVAIAAVVTIAVLMALPRPSGSLGSPGPTDLPSPGQFDPTGGAGLVSGGTGIPWIVVTLIPLLIASFIVGRRLQRRGHAVLALALTLATIGLIRLGTYDSVAWTDGSYAIGQPGVRQDAASPTGRTRVTFAVAPRGVLTFGFDVTNTGPWPITILGVAPTDPMFSWGRIGAVGVPPRNEVTAEPSRLRAFAPAVVQPGEKLFLVIAGIATPCALGRDNAGEVDGVGAYILPIDVVYEVAGMRRASAVTPPIEGYIPTVGGGGNCSPTPVPSASAESAP